MIYSTTSSGTVIAKIARDLRPGTADWQVDALDWIAEALEFIGYENGFIEKTLEGSFENYKFSLPADFYSDPRIDYRTYETSDYDPIFAKTARQGGYKLDPYSRSIQMPQETGFFQITYRGWETDNDGYPLMPDNVYFREALFWYILSKLLMGGYTHPQFSYDFAINRWNKYCTAARNDAAFPSYEKAVATAVTHTL